MLPAEVGMRGIGGVACVAALCFASGCGPFAVQQGARTVKPGKMVAGMALGATNISEEEEAVGAKSNDTVVMMVPQGWARFGLSDRMDAGMQVYGSGVRTDLKIAPVQSASMAVAIDVGVSGYYQSNRDPDGNSLSSNYWGDLGALFTLAMGPNADLNLAARYLIGESYSKEDSDFDGEYRNSTQLSGFGGAIGLQIRRGTFAISPELAVYQVTSRETEFPDSEAESLVVAPTVGFSVGF